MKCHEVDYEIFGDDLQIVEVELDPQEVVIAEAGAMNYMEDGISFDARMGDGSVPDRGIFGMLLDAGKRVLTGESIFLTHFTNQGSGRKRVAFASPYPGKIVALDLTTVGGQLLCQKDSFLCAAYGTAVSIAFNKRLGTGFFGGEGFILQRISSESGDGLVFMHAGGSVLRRDLAAGETLRVDTGCLVAFQHMVSYEIQWVKGIKNKLFGGEGLFFAALRGPGTVWLQTLPFSRLADRVYAAAPQAGGKNVGEGSLLNTVFDVIGGD